MPSLGPVGGFGYKIFCGLSLSVVVVSALSRSSTRLRGLIVGHRIGYFGGVDRTWGNLGEGGLHRTHKKKRD